MRVASSEAGHHDFLFVRPAIPVGVLHKQNIEGVGPPKRRHAPTAIPEGMFKPSAKTVNLSARPSPSVSSRILTRSRPGPGRREGIEALGNPETAPFINRHRHWIDEIRFMGDGFHGEALGDGRFLMASAGDGAGPGGLS